MNEPTTQLPDVVDGKTSTALAQQSQPRVDLAETAGTAVAAQAKAAIEARYLVARANPRNWLDVRSRILETCQRTAFAEKATYTIKRGRSITGLTIRFAEEAMRCMHNILAETMVVYDDDEQRIVRVTVTDLESNLSYPHDVHVRKTVERRFGDDREIVSQRTNSKGQTTFIVRATEDEVTQKQSAMVSKAMRNEVLRLLPADIKEEAFAQVLETKKAGDKQDPAGARKRLADSFYTMGVTVEEIEIFLDCKLEQMTDAQLEMLRSLYNAINDGETTWRAVMEEREGVVKGGEKPKAKGASTDDVAGQLGIDA